jgi:translation initiation factor 3 subunit C
LKKPALNELKKKDAEKHVEKHVRENRAAKVEKSTEIKPVVPKAEITEKELDEKVAELVTSRGRKGADQREMVRNFEVLSKTAKAFGSLKEIPVLMHLVSAMFDSQRNIDDFMDHLQWNSCYRSLCRVISLLEAQPQLRLRPYGSDELANLTISSATSEAGNSISVGGNLDAFIVKLEEEYTKSLQQINPHTKVIIFSSQI